MPTGSRDDEATVEAFAATVMSGLAETLGAVDRADLARGASPGEPGLGTPERYAIGGVLGQGGMGRVIEATDRWFGRRVALKELLGESSPDAVVRRFVLEALVTGNLEHPGIVPVYERGTRDGRPYYVMRKLEGRTVAAALAGARNLRERLQLVPHLVRVAQTLAFAHERGVIHRDLKPQNLVLGPHGEVTVIDWGIARVRALDRLGIDLAPGASVDTMLGGATAAGSVLGTAAYMAPEQAAGKLDAIDERTDVFALGAVLYHVLAGRPPFEAPTPASQLVKAMEVDCPPLSVAAPRAPAPLVAICERALARDPEARYRSAREMAEALGDALTDALAGKESRGVHAFTAVVSVLVVAAAVVGGIATWWLMPPFEVLGQGVFILLGWTAIGVVFGILELVTKGRYRLASLVLAFTGLTFIAGAISTMMGVHRMLEAALDPAILADGARWREVITAGTYESLGNAVAGTAMTGVLLLFWGVASRRAARAAARVRAADPA